MNRLTCLLIRFNDLLSTDWLIFYSVYKHIFLYVKFYIQYFILGTFFLQKIDKYRSKDPEKFKTINAIVEEEQPAGKKGLSEGCVGVLWLKR